MTSEKILPTALSDVSSDSGVDSDKSFLPVHQAGKNNLNKTLFTKVGANAFETESLDSFYKPIESYEGYHRYDPSFSWEPAEERRLVRKV